MLLACEVVGFCEEACRCVLVGALWVGSHLKQNHHAGRPELCLIPAHFLLECDHEPHFGLLHCTRQARVVHGLLEPGQV